jgi:hypothetical protein
MSNYYHNSPLRSERFLWSKHFAFLPYFEESPVTELKGDVGLDLVRECENHVQLAQLHCSLQRFTIC